MSAYRDSLDEETRARYDEATARAGRLLGIALAELWRDAQPAEQAA